MLLLNVDLLASAMLQAIWLATALLTTCRQRINYFDDFFQSSLIFRVS